MAQGMVANKIGWLFGLSTSAGNYQREMKTYAHRNTWTYMSIVAGCITTTYHCSDRHTEPLGGGVGEDTVQPARGESSDQGSCSSPECMTSSERSQTQKATEHEHMHMKCPE